LKASPVLTAEQLRHLAAKTRRLIAGRTVADAAMMEAYAVECDDAADKADALAEPVAAGMPPRK